MKMTQDEATEIIKQLGGMNKLSVMINAKNFMFGDALTFKFSGSPKINFVKITLTTQDLYNIEFGKISGLNYTEISKFDGAMIETVIYLFERETGLRLSL